MTGPGAPLVYAITGGILVVLAAVALVIAAATGNFALALAALTTAGIAVGFIATAALVDPPPRQTRR